VVVVDEVVTLTGTEVETTGTETKGTTETTAVIVVDVHEKMNGIQVTVKMSGTDATKMIAIQDVMMTAARKILSAEADRHRKENQSPLQKEEVSPPVLAA
jgi:tryptophanyl-tRNA synthetase